jgi:glycine cleavage system H protein
LASKIPPELKYSESHEWVRVEGDVATIGITDFAQHSLTDVVFVELPKKGAKIQHGKSFGVVESVKSVSELFAPLSGEVVEVNDTLTKTPEKINDDPYGAGWMIRVKLASKDDVKKLLDAKKYKATVGE